MIEFTQIFDDVTVRRSYLNGSGVSCLGAAHFGYNYLLS